MSTFVLNRISGSSSNPVWRCLTDDSSSVDIINSLTAMKTFIIPYDFSVEAANGLEMGIALARKFSGRLQLVYVVNGRRDFATIRPEEERAMAQKAFDELLPQVKERLGEGCELDYIIKQGKVYREVVAQAEAHKNPVIVTSTHGASGFEEFFIGSNTLRMIASAHCPIFTIMHGIEPKETYDTIVFPLDISFQSRQKAPYVAKLAKLYGARVHILACVEGTLEETVLRLNTYRQQMVDYFNKQDVPVSAETRVATDLVDETIAYAMDSMPSMIAITPREKDTFHLFLVGGKAQQLISQSPVPVVVIPPSVMPINPSFQTQGCA